MPDPSYRINVLTPASAVIDMTVYSSRAPVSVLRGWFSQNGAVLAADRVLIETVSTNGVTPTVQTPEKFNSLSPVAVSSAVTNWATSPTIVATKIALGATRFTPAGKFNVWWTNCNPLNPLVNAHSTLRFGIRNGSTGTANTANKGLAFTELAPRHGFLRIGRGRRSTKAGYRLISESAPMCFLGSTATPLEAVCSPNLIYYVCSGDWPAPISQGWAINLLGTSTGVPAAVTVAYAPLLASLGVGA